MWIAILIAVIIAAVGGLVYLVSRVYKFPFWKKLTGRRWLRIIYAALAVAIVIAILVPTIGYINAVISLIVLVLFWLVCNLIMFVAGKIRKKHFNGYWAAAPAFVAAVVYLAVGWALAHNVWVTQYRIETDKEISKLRVIMFADSHIGATFDGDGFALHVKNIQNQNPDVVIIAGDFIDDGTTKSDMEKACAALGTLETTYGVYYSFGNHDKGYYDSRGYSGDDLIAALEKNNVTVLEDEAVLLNDEFYIIGRQDASEAERGEARAEIADIVASLDSEKFMIVIDHQPNDYEKEAKAGVDLVLSGHTHGGQLFPITYFGEWIGANDRTYGYERRNNTQFIVTSGISDWELKFKTGTKSEFVVIDIE